ncbi:MAG TPA: PHB depolymerase family esterase [Myxococcota bacterium]|nr:PHB depolymerase family esterase [Myxococcota bacterium]
MRAWAAAAVLSWLVAAGASAAPPAPGDSARRIAWAGEERSYLLHVPPRLADPLALVVVLHGGGGNARAVMLQTGFSDAADLHGFVAVYPNGSQGTFASLFAVGRPKFLVWNGGSCCGFASEHRIDDVGFVRAVVADVERELPIDRRRVYATGISNGGMMSYRLACEASDLFAAVGVVSGALVTPSCAPAEPVSVVHFHGDADHYVPLAGGAGRLTPRGYAYPPTESAIAFWRAADGCGAEPSESTPRPGVHLRSYGDCRSGTEVAFYLIDGGAHSWPGGDRVSVILPEVSQAIPATPVIWDFFASHPKR